MRRVKDRAAGDRAERAVGIARWVLLKFVPHGNTLGEHMLY